MFVIGNVLLAVAKIIDIVLTAYTWIIIAQAILSWVRPDPSSPVVRFLYSVTEPVLRPIRRRLPVFFGGLDLSPLIIILIIIFLQHVVVDNLRQIAIRM